MSEANRTSHDGRHDSDGAETDRQPFTARATNARIRARDGVVDFGTPQRERVDDAGVTVEATAADDAVPEPAVSISVTASLGGDGGDGGDDAAAVAVAVSLVPTAARELAELAETTVPAVAGLGRLWYDSNEATLVSDDSAEAGVLYFGDDDSYDPSVVIGSGWPEINAAARLSLADLRALSDALRHEAEIVEQGGVEK